MKALIIGVTVGLGLGLASAWSAETVGGGCFVVCKGEAKTCDVQTKAVQKPDFSSGKPVIVMDCLSAKSIGKSDIGINYRSEGKAGSATIPGDKNMDFKTKLASVKTLDCLVGDSSSCVNNRFVTATMGKAFDAAAPSEIAGNPCSLALPCGKVGLAADGSLVIRLAEPNVRGALTLYPSRGGGVTQQATFANSLATLPAGALKPGETYRYKLALDDGKVRASGEFAVLSQRAQKDSDTALAEAMKQPEAARGQAVVESLLLDGREWEAFEMTLEGSK